MMRMRAKDGYVAERYIDHSVPYIRVKYKNKHRDKETQSMFKTLDLSVLVLI